MCVIGLLLMDCIFNEQRITWSSLLPKVAVVSSFVKKFSIVSNIKSSFKKLRTCKISTNGNDLFFSPERSCCSIENIFVRGYQSLRFSLSLFQNLMFDSKVNLFGAIVRSLNRVVVLSEEFLRVYALISKDCKWSEAAPLQTVQSTQSFQNVLSFTKNKKN